MATVTETAAAIARVRAAESALDPAARLFEDPFATLFAGDAAISEMTDRLLTVPFFREQVRLRTRFIDDFVRQGISDGVGQIVVLGAGFDCRPLRLQEIANSGATVFEVDFSAQLEAKRTILRGAGIDIPTFVRSVACDFSIPDFEPRLSEGLAHATFSSRMEALFVVEGVVSYLGETALDHTLRWIAGVAVVARLVFNYPISRLDPGQLPPRLMNAGFMRAEDHSLAAIHRRYLPGEPPPGGDLHRIAVART